MRKHPFQAMILAAGLGKRLRPYTDNLPKALVEINGRPILGLLLDKMKAEGCRRVVVNIHYLGSLITDYLATYPFEGMQLVISDESALLLETGGALRKAADLFLPELPVVVHNVDILSDLSFQDLLSQHLNSDSLLTLAVRRRQSSRYLAFNNDGQLTGWINIKTGETLGEVDEQLSDFFAFSGVHVASWSFFKLIKEMEEERPFSVIPLWIKLCKGYSVKCFDHSFSYWSDIGTPSDLEIARTNFRF